MSDNVTRYLRSIFKRFELEKIRYCVLHAYEDLPNSVTSDVDMAVDSDGMRRAEPILYECADTCGLKIIQRLYYDVPQSLFYVLFFRRSDGRPGFLKLDIMYDGFGIGAYLIESEVLLSGRRKFREFYVPAIGGEVCYLLIKRVMKGNLSHEHGQHLKSLIEADPAGSKRFSTRFFGKRNWILIERVIRGGASEGNADGVERLRRALILRRRVLMPHLVALKVILEIWRVFCRIRQPAGLTVALVSPDGGGKSTLANAILKRLGPGFRRTRKIHWRPCLLPPPGSIIRPGKWKEVDSIYFKPHSRPPKGRFSSVIRFVYYTADYILGFIPAILWPKIRAGLVVIERYYYDFLHDPVRFRLDIPACLPRTFMRFIPEPDLTILLSAPAKIIFARKQEISLEEIERQLGSILRLQSQLQNTHVVDVDQPFDAEVCQAEDLIIEALASRLRRRPRK